MAANRVAGIVLWLSFIVMALSIVRVQAELSRDGAQARQLWQVNHVLLQL